MKITKTIEKMGELVFDLPMSVYILMMIVYTILTPIWLPVYLIAKFIDFYKKAEK